MCKQCHRTVLDPFLNGTKNNDFDAKRKLSLNSKFSLSNSYIYISPYKYIPWKTSSNVKVLVSFISLSSTVQPSSIITPIGSFSSLFS